MSGLESAGRMRLNQMRTEPVHVGVVVDDHVAAHGVFREPCGDLRSPARSRNVTRSLVEHTAGESLRVEHLL